MADGLDIVRKIYISLRRPSDEALPYRIVLDKLSSVIGKYKLDLTLSEQNQLAKTSGWFSVNQTDFVIGTKCPDILMPIRVERRGIDADSETGDDVPIVNFQVLDTSIVGAVSFYGSPMRMAFRENYDAVTGRQYRIVYETDFIDTVDLDVAIDLPEYFSDLLAGETALLLMPLIEDDTPQFDLFYKRQAPILSAEVLQWQNRWDVYRKKFKGKSKIPKVLFGNNNRGVYGYRRRVFE